MSLLIHEQIDLNDKLCKACFQGNLEIVKYLIKVGVHIDKFSIGYASEQGHLDIVHYLESIILKDKRLKCLKNI